jgi:peptidoglycan/xylan/chitin deacetylase (PgdA/CDA1 family)
MNFRSIFLILAAASMLLGGCRKASQATPAAVPSSTSTPVFTLTPTGTSQPTSATLTRTPAPSPTATAMPTVTATPEPIRRTPPTLMLHRKNITFDSVQFLKDFIVILKKNNMHVVTYEDIRKNPAITAREHGKLFIISIDDLYLRYPIDPSVLEMIALLRQAGYPAVLGVVTESDYTYPETIKTYRELSAIGWEIASHTDRHSNLGVMERTAPRYVYTEVQTSVDKIQEAVGVRPYTLVLPEGQMVNDPRFIKRAGIVWIVGINGGSTYDSRKEIVYVGREGPDGSAEQTFKIMMGRFNP